MQIWRLYQQIKNGHLHLRVFFKPHEFVVKPINFDPVGRKYLPWGQPLLAKSVKDFTFESENYGFMIQLYFKLPHLILHGFLLSLVELIINVIKALSVFLHYFDKPLVCLRLDFLFLGCAEWLKKYSFQQIFGDLLSIKELWVIIRCLQWPRVLWSSFETSHRLKDCGWHIQHIAWNLEQLCKRLIALSLLFSILFQNGLYRFRFLLIQLVLNLLWE